MLIELQKISAKNFMSIGNTPVEVALNDYKKSLIIGKNGNGKSVLIEAIIFALYGKPYRKINKGALVNSINGKRCEVTLEFVSNGINYRVVRTIKPDDLKIYENDVLITQEASVGDYQSMLEVSILKMDYKTCCQMVIIGSMGYVPFLQLKSAERRLFVEAILSLELFSTMNKNLKTILADEKTKYTTSQNALNIYKNKIESYNGTIRLLETDKTTKINLISNQIKDKMVEYRAVESAYKVAVDELSAHNFDDTSNENQRIINEESTKVSIAQSTNGKLQNKIKYFDITAECSVCGQEINPEHKNKHITEMTAEIETNNNIINTSTKIIQDNTALLSIINGNKQGKRVAEQKVSTTKDSMEWVKRELIRLGKDKEALSQNDDKTLSETTLLLEENINLHADEVITSKEFFTNIEVYDTMLTSLKDSEAKAEIVKQYIPVINHTVNMYMEKLGLYIKFELDENFNETLKSRHRDDFTYESFSMGERMRIDASLLFAWREITKIRTGVETNLLFWDEVLEILDDDGFDVILGVVDSTPNMNCFIISHKQNLDVKFDNVIEMIKVHDFTQIK